MKQLWSGTEVTFDGAYTRAWEGAEKTGWSA